MTSDGQRPALAVTITPEPDDASVLRVALEGDLDTFSAATLRDALTGLEQQEPRRIVVDLAAVTFIDSAGIGVLVGARRRTNERGAELVAERPSVGVRRVFDMTHLSAAFGLDGEGPPTT